MKLYVGAWSDGCGGVFAADATGATCRLADGGVGEARRMALVILTHHLKDTGRALSMCDAFERRFGPRLQRSFWTVRENEILEAVARIESGDRTA